MSPDMTYPDPTSTTLTATRRCHAARLPGGALSPYPGSMGLPERSWLRAAFGVVGIAAAGWVSYVWAPGRETGLPGLPSAPSPALTAPLSPRGDQGGETLVAASDAPRPTPGRLAAGFAYTAYDPAASAPSASSRPDRLEAELRIKQRAEAAAATPADLGAQATVDLAHRRYGLAIRGLERACAEAPRDAGLWSDLAAAYLGQAESEARPFDLVRALAAADRALGLAADLSAARFNRALALQSLFLSHEARQAWQAYLELDGGSGWAGEARRRLADLATPDAAELSETAHEELRRNALAGNADGVRSRVLKAHQWARENAEEVLLAQAAELLSPELLSPEDAVGADAAFTVARAVARVLAAEYGEQMLRESLDSMEQARVETAGERRFSLLNGHRFFRQAMDFYDGHEAAEARALFEKARAELERGGSPFAAWAELYMASCDFRLWKHSEATAVLGELRPRVDASRYPVLLARVDLLRGLIRVRTGHLVRALTIFKAALDTLERVGLSQEAAFIHNATAESYEFLGQGGEAWMHRYEALALTPEIADKVRLHVFFDGAANAVQQAGEPGVALYFRDEVYRVAQAIRQEHSSRAFALQQRAETLHRLGEEEAALRDLASARLQMGRIAGAGERRREEATFQLARGEILLESRPGQALDALTAALGSLHEIDPSLDATPGVTLTRLYLARARGYRLVGEDARAQHDLQRGIERYERDRARMDNELFRRTYFEQAQGLFDEQVRLNWNRSDGRLKALEYSERKRSRELLDVLLDQAGSASPAAEGGGRPPDADALRQRMAPGTSLVEYALLKDRFFAWVVREDRVVSIELSASPVPVGGRTEELRALLQKNAPAAELRPLATELYQAVLGPVMAEVPAEDLLVVVPDKSLHALAFAALVNPATGRYLAEEHPVAVAPSATFYVGASGRDEPSGPPSALLLGDPAIRRDLHPNLPPLRAAATVVERLAAFYPRSRTLVGEEATPRMFLEEAGRYPVVHFAGHALTNPKVPSTSRLLMAPENSSDLGILYARDIRQARFASTRLVVLAACDSASGPISDTEGTLNLARPFLLAGVDAAVASLWQVDDAATAELFVRFHSELASGVDAARALRTAQLALLQDSPEYSSPSHWAGFQLIGRAVTFHHP